MTSNPLPDLLRFLYTLLSTDAALAALVTGDDGLCRVYEAQAPESAVYPFVLFTVLVAPHTTGNGATRVYTRPLVRIEALGQTESLLSLEPIAARIDALLGSRAAALSGALQVMGSYCERAIAPPPETDEGSVYRRLGGEYRLFVHPAA